MKTHNAIVSSYFLPVRMDDPVLFLLSWENTITIYIIILKCPLVRPLMGASVRRSEITVKTAFDLLSSSQRPNCELCIVILLSTVNSALMPTIGELCGISITQPSPQDITNEKKLAHVHCLSVWRKLCK